MTFKNDHEQSIWKVAKTWSKSTINNNKKLKINLMNITESSMKGMIKKHKKTRNKLIDWRKERNVRFFFHPLKTLVDFLCSTEKKLTLDQNRGRMT